MNMRMRTFNFLTLSILFLPFISCHLSFIRDYSSPLLQRNSQSSPSLSSSHQIAITMPTNLETMKQGEQITFPLPNDYYIIGVISNVYNHPDKSSWTVIGELTGSDIGSFTLGCGLVDQTVSCVGNIRPLGNSTQFELRRVDDSHLMTSTQVNIYEDQDGRALEIKQALHAKMLEETRNINHNTNQINSPRHLVDSNDIIDIMVVYTPAARIWAGGVGAMELLIDMAIDESNQILLNSNVDLRFRLVHQMQTYDTSYTDPSSALTNLLYYFTYFQGETNDPNGLFDAEQALRDTYQADILVVISGPGDVCGVGWLLTSSGASKWAVSLTAVNCMVGYYTFAHEIGHNFGSHHDATASGTRLYPYSQGWCWDTNTAQSCDGTCMRSVMAYSSCVSAQLSCTGCPKTLYYSTPNVIVHGNPAGDASTADNARSINNFKSNAVAFRTSLSSGGIIFSVEPSSTNINVCTQVVINGWRIGAGSDITSVTFGGVEVGQIVSQTMDSVVVNISPISSVSSTPVDIVITTSAGKTTTLAQAFSFLSASSNVVLSIDFETSYSPLQSTGELGWYLYNAPCPAASSTDPCYRYGPTTGTGTFSMVDADGSNRDGIYSLDLSQGSCIDTLVSVSLKYYAYSYYSFCYPSNFLKIEVQFTAGGDWTSIASTSAITASSTSAWNTLTTSIQPTVVYGLRFRVITYNANSGCSYYNPVALDDLVINYQHSCSENCDPSTTSTPSRVPTRIPSRVPSVSPSRIPTLNPTLTPTKIPSGKPTIIPTRLPTQSPSPKPSTLPSSKSPSLAPSRQPTRGPSLIPTRLPTKSPSLSPSKSPSRAPSRQPTRLPSFIPTKLPTKSPSISPTRVPTKSPSRSPSRLPSRSPTFPPTRSPTLKPSLSPTRGPTLVPSKIPTRFPSRVPTRTPTLSPSRAPTRTPTRSPIV